MARSLLQSFVSGTRQMLAVQLFISVGTVALAGYTATVTNRAIQERNRLSERVIQLEQTLGEADIVPPEATTIPVQAAETIYPPSVEQAADPSAPADQPAVGAPVEPPPATPTETPNPTVGQAVDEARPADAAPAADAAPPAAEAPAFDPAQLLRDLLTPPPPLRTLVLHVRDRADYDEAQVIQNRLSGDNLNVSIDIMPPGDQRQSGYAYFHGRQSGPAAQLVQRLQDAARGAEIAPWVAQLRGVALPASGEYTPDRLDVVLPPLPAPETPQLRFNPALRERAVNRPPG